MKKMFVAGIIALAMIVHAYAQSAGTNESRLLGTWVDFDGLMTWTFNADGTLQVVNQGEEDYVQYRATGTSIAIYDGEDTNVAHYSISSDGQTLIFETFDGAVICLIKKK
jgi:hypothetical protein